jgi:hypothetical protein
VRLAEHAAPLSLQHEVRVVEQRLVLLRGLLLALELGEEVVEPGVCPTPPTPAPVLLGPVRAHEPYTSKSLRGNAAAAEAPRAGREGHNVSCVCAAKCLYINLS